jgi:hypothetical protein
VKASLKILYGETASVLFTLTLATGVAIDGVFLLVVIVLVVITWRV